MRVRTSVGLPRPWESQAVGAVQGGGGLPPMQAEKTKTKPNNAIHGWGGGGTQAGVRGGEEGAQAEGRGAEGTRRQGKARKWGQGTEVGARQVNTLSWGGESPQVTTDSFSHPNSHCHAACLLTSSLSLSCCLPAYFLTLTLMLPACSLPHSHPNAACLLTSSPYSHCHAACSLCHPHPHAAYLL